MQDIVRVRSTAQIAGHPIHPMPVPITIAGFIGALLVADDSGNTVWRVTAAHAQVTQR
ncbi:hypothetical protein [Bradyrhizobium manausense]|uniref:hypothetical protein n=1 Tax=Bradyrhizobium manausense TaxID=989370 RepID=UPI001BA99758|nr:hypothetical protein [Bradyrhizobium manausense]MBR0721726.1 hypothetical protein [Bradyrhizobium manausense]